MTLSWDNDSPDYIPLDEADDDWEDRIEDDNPWD